MSWTEAYPGKTIHDYNAYVQKTLEKVAEKYPKRQALSKEDADKLVIKNYDSSKLPNLFEGQNVSNGMQFM